METLLTRPVVIAMALAGAMLCLLAMLLRRRAGRRNLVRRIDAASYVFTGISILLFVIAGFRGQA